MTISQEFLVAISDVFSVCCFVRVALCKILKHFIESSSKKMSGRNMNASYNRHLNPNQHQSRSNQGRWPVTLAHHVPFSKDYRQIFNNDKESSYDGFMKQSNNSGNHTNDLREIRQISPHAFPMRTQAQDNSLNMRGSPIHNFAGFNNIPTASTIDQLQEYSGISDYSIRGANELRRSPQNSTAFYRRTPPDDRQKSESPTRKRLRVSQVESPPLRWEQRRSRRHRHRRHHTRNSTVRKLRYGGYNGPVWERSESYRHPISPPRGSTHGGNTFHHTLHPSPSGSPLQPALMVDVSQVPMTMPVSIYTPHIAVCQGNTPSMHNIYASQPSAHFQPACQVASQYASCITATQHQHIAHAQSYLTPTTATSPLHYTPPRSTDTVLHVSPPPPIYISENQSAQLDMNARARSGMVSNILRPTARRWRYHPFPATTQYQHFLQLFAMIATPLSPEMRNPDSEMENYEALLHVAERLSEEKPKGLSKFEISQIPSFKFDRDNDAGNQKSCVVCMCDFEQHQTLRDLPCSHKFHLKCVDKWLRTNRTCPICRGDASGESSMSD